MYIKTKLFVAKILSETESVGVLLNTQWTKVSHNKRVKENVWEYRVVQSGLYDAITEEEFLLYYHLAQESARVYFLVPSDSLDDYEKVLINSYSNVTKSNTSSLDYFVYTGMVNATIGVAAADDYELLMRVNRWGGVRFMQLYKTGATDAHVALGFMDTNMSEEIFMAQNKGSVPNFGTGEDNTIYVVDLQPPIDDDPVLGAFSQGFNQNAFS